jgi:hypothetical protein
MLKKFENLSTKTAAEQSMSLQTLLASVMDEKGQNYGATTTGSFIMTMHLPTCP